MNQQQTQRQNTNIIFVVQIRVYHNDHLGSTSLIANETGELVEETFYSPYGEILSGGGVSRYQYEGKEFSSQTGDYDFNFRKYNPELGIFTQPDALISNVYDPQSLNRYSFERNNPYKYVDEDGKVAVVVLGIAAIAVLSGLLVANLYTQRVLIEGREPTVKRYGTYFAGGSIGAAIGVGAGAIALGAGATIGVASAVGIVGSFVSGTNSQAFINAGTGRPVTEGALFSGFAGLSTYGLGRVLPTPESVDSPLFFLNSFTENYVGGLFNTVYDFIVGSGDSQQSSQQIDSTRSSNIGIGSGGGGSSNGVIYLNNPSRDSSSNTGSSSSRGGISGAINRAIGSVRDFFGGLF